VDENKVPSITISLNSSQEDFASIGDIHHQSAQPGPDRITDLTGGFVPASYNASTGECAVPVDLENIFPGMQLLDSSGRRHTIREVWDDSVLLDPGIMTDLGQCRIVSTQTTVVALESLAFKESFTVACHAPNEPVYLTYLHSIVTFILLRYKEELMEARGLERTTISSGEVYLNTSFNGQIVFTRPITVYGYVRNYWPKVVKQQIQGLTVGVSVGEPQKKTEFVAAYTGGGSWLTAEAPAPANVSAIIFGNTYAGLATTASAGLVKLWREPVGEALVPIVDPQGKLEVGDIYSNGRKLTVERTSDEENDDPGFREVVGFPFPTAIIWWTDESKTAKIKEKVILRNPNQTPSQIVFNYYREGAVQRTVTDVISYSGVFEISRTRSIS
jgi:hypothetical protein